MATKQEKQAWGDYFSGLDGENQLVNNVGWGGSQEQPPEEHGVWDNIVAGAGQTVSGVGGILSMLGADNVGRAVSDYGDEVYQNNATQRTTPFKLSELLDPSSQAWNADVPQMIPSALSLVIPGMGASGLAARGLLGAGRTMSMLSNAERLSLLAKAGMAGGATSGVLESLQEGGNVTNDQLDLWQKQAQQLYPNDKYAQDMYYNQNKGNAQEAGWKDTMLNLPATVGTSMLEGAIPFGNFAGKIPGAVKLLGSMAGEGGQEIYQNWASDYTQNKPFNITDPENIEAGALGALMGGAVGIGGHIINSNTKGIDPQDIPISEVVDNMTNRETSHMWQTQILPMVQNNPELQEAFKIDSINSNSNYQEKVNQIKDILKANEDKFEDHSIFPERAYGQTLTKYVPNTDYVHDSEEDTYAKAHTADQLKQGEYNNVPTQSDYSTNPNFEMVGNSYDPNNMQLLPEAKRMGQQNLFGNDNVPQQQQQVIQPQQPVNEPVNPNQQSLFSQQEIDNANQPYPTSVVPATKERAITPIEGTQKQNSVTGDNFQLAQTQEQPTNITDKLSQATAAFKQAKESLRQQVQTGQITPEIFDKKTGEWKEALSQYTQYLQDSQNKPQEATEVPLGIDQPTPSPKKPDKQALGAYTSDLNKTNNGTMVSYTLSNGKTYKSTIAKVQNNIAKLDTAIAEINAGKWNSENPYYQKGMSRKKALANFESAKTELQGVLEKSNQTAQRDSAQATQESKEQTPTGKGKPHSEPKKGDIAEAIKNGDIYLGKNDKPIAANKKGQDIIDAKKQTASTKLNSGFDPVEAYNTLKPLVGKAKEAMPKLVELGKHVYSQGKTDIKSWASGMKTHLKDLFDNFKGKLNQIWKYVNNERGAVKVGSIVPPKDTNKVEFSNEALKSESIKKKADKFKNSGWAETIVKDGKVYVRPKNNATPYTTYSKKYDSLLAGKPTKKELKGVKGKIYKAMDDFRTNWIDDLHPLLKIPGGEYLYKLAWATRGWAGKAEVLLGNENFNEKDIKKLDNYLMSKYGHKSFQSIIRNVQSKLDQFGEYAYAMRVANWKRDIEEEMSKQHAQEIISKAPAYFKTALDDLVKLNNHLQDILVDGGIISKETKKQWNDVDPYYVPLHKEFDDNSIEELHRSKGFTNVASPIKKLKGSQGHLTYNPVESMVKNIYSFVNIAERNKVGKEFVGMSGNLPDLVSKVEGKYTSDPKNSIFTVWDNGSKQAYSTSPELYRVMSMLDGESAGDLFKILQYPAKTLRYGATLTPDFVARNLVRDQISAFFFSKHGYIPLWDAFKGIMSYLKKDKLYFDYLNSGASQSHFLSFDREGLTKNVEGLMKKGAVSGAWAKYNPIELMRWASEISEIGTRLGEFKNAQEGYNGLIGRMTGSKTKLSDVDLAIAPRDVTIDFSRSGLKGKELNKYIAFFNANVQGLDKMYREFKTNPATATFKSLLFITLPSLLLWNQNKDDKVVQDLPKWQKDLFWIVHSGNTVYRIPKPFELGTIFASAFERGMDAIKKKDPRAFKNFQETLIDQIPNPIKFTALLPFIEWATNYSFFTHRAIVPQSEQKLPPHLQASPYNSELSKLIGKTDLVSPRHVDNFIRNYFGTLGGIVSNDLGNSVIGNLSEHGERPAKSANDIPLVRAFTIDPSKSSESVNTFYDRINELEVERNGYKAEHDGSDKGFDKGKLLELKKLHQIQKKVTEVNQLSEDVAGNKGMSSDSKRAKIDKLREQQLKLIQGGKS